MDDFVWAGGDRLYFAADADGSRPIFTVNIRGDARRGDATGGDARRGNATAATFAAEMPLACKRRCQPVTTAVSSSTPARR